MFRAPGLAGSALAPVADASMGNGDDSHGRRDDSLPTNLERYPKRRRGTDGQTFDFASSTSAPVPTLIPASRTSAKAGDKVNDVTIAGDFLETPVPCSTAMPGIDGVIDFLYFGILPATCTARKSGTRLAPVRQERSNADMPIYITNATTLIARRFSLLDCDQKGRHKHGINQRRLRSLDAILLYLYRAGHGDAAVAATKSLKRKS